MSASSAAFCFQHVLPFFNYKFYFSSVRHRNRLVCNGFDSRFAKCAKITILLRWLLTFVFRWTSLRPDWFNLASEKETASVFGARTLWNGFSLNSLQLELALYWWATINDQLRVFLQFFLQISVSEFKLKFAILWYCSITALIVLRFRWSIETVWKLCAFRIFRLRWRECVNVFNSFLLKRVLSFPVLNRRPSAKRVNLVKRTAPFLQIAFSCTNSA